MPRASGAAGRAATECERGAASGPEGQFQEDDGPSSRRRAAPAMVLEGGAQGGRREPRRRAREAAPSARISESA
eukprot:8059546-Alexandrium_andersonii.AAC.1